jgi:AhpD family alkylhydroperoxidase
LPYLAVSASNQCGYCIASHHCRPPAKLGMTDAMLTELLAVVGDGERDPTD